MVTPITKSKPTALAASLTAFIAVACSSAVVRGQELLATTQPSDAYIPSDGETKHIERQASVALAQVGTTLDANPPTTSISDQRGLALTLLDTVLHDPFAPRRPTIGQFRIARTKQAIEQMQHTKVTDGSAIIWQIYNMGFVVRTKSATLGFDLVKLKHVPAIALDDQTLHALVDQCDALFVSHEHLDHADRDVAEWFTAAGKPVVAPEAMWLGEPLHDKLTHLLRDAKPQPLDLKPRGATLQVTVYPGFQHLKDDSDVENNVYTITTPEGLRISHTGDNNVAAGLPSVAKGVAAAPVDVLMMKLEPGDLNSRDIVRAFAPKLMLPSHFEELGHVNVNGREPYWRGMERVLKLQPSSVLMMWGEQYRYISIQK